jgi:biopolymer transport protein ExbD
MSWTSILISMALLAGSIHPGAPGNAAFAQASTSQNPNVAIGSPPTLEELLEKLRPSKNEILVQKNGQIILNGSPLTIEELPERLRQEKAADPSFTVNVRGDLGDLYHETVAVTDIVDSVGVSTAPFRTRNIIVINKGGRVILNGSPLSMEELRDKLGKAKAEDPLFRVRVGAHAESDLSYSDIAKVLDMVKELDIGVGLATGRIDR